MKFLRFREFSIVPGDRFVLASDAVEVFGAGKGNVRQIEHYAEILPLLRMADPQQAAEKLLATTREREVEKNKTSDDATFVVVDI